MGGANHEWVFGLPGNFPTSVEQCTEESISRQDRRRRVRSPGLEFKLEQNTPTPFNQATVIRFQLPEEDHVNLRIFDVLGRDVAVLVEEVMTRGE